RAADHLSRWRCQAPCGDDGGQSRYRARRRHGFRPQRQRRPKGIGVLATKPSNIVIQGNTKNGITTIDALKGKKVGVSSVGALTYWMAQKLSQHQGWGLGGM